jgi:hypothetical protein
MLAIVFEVLPEFGLAHLRTEGGRVLGINRQTPGIEFDAVSVGQCLACEVQEPFGRVIRATQLETK